jgi:uncharacterized protein
MIDQTFVFDGVIHLPDLSVDEELLVQTIDLGDRLTGGLVDTAALMSGDIPASLTGHHEAIYDVVFNQSPTDMGMIGNMPFVSIDVLDDPDRLLKLAHGFASQYSTRCIFAGGTDPAARGLNHALDSIDFQIRELGAKTIKFYPFEWRCDDEKVAYPMYEKCRSLGVNVVQFHKCLPVFQATNVEVQRPNDLQGAARDFPDMTFVMHHPLPLYFDETVNIAQRFPNIHLLLAPLLHLLLLKPRAIQKMVGELLQQIGSEKLLYGSEGPIAGNPTRIIQAFMDMQIPQDLRDGYGYPQITNEDKANILGLNCARMFGVDVDAKQRELATVNTGS